MVSLCRGVGVDGLPVVVSSLGAGCLCRMVFHSSSGEGVGCAACRIGCRGQFPRWCCVSDVLPVPVDWLPLSVSVGWSACGGQFPRCWVSVSDGLPVGLVAVVCCRWDVLPVVADWWPLGCAACGCGLVAVVCVGGMCCLWLLIGGRWDVLPVVADWWPLDVLPVVVSSLGAGCRWDSLPQFQR